MRLIVICLVLLSFARAFGENPHRQLSLDVVTKLRDALLEVEQRQDAVIEAVSSAKQETTEALRNFYFSLLHIKTESLKGVLEEEVELQQSGETVDPWCWVNNLPLIEGAMGWLGNGYSNCVTSIDRQLKDIVGTIMARFQANEEAVTKYSVLQVFEKKNIITDPLVISAAIDELDLTQELTDLNLSEVIRILWDDLNARLLVFDDCLKNKREELRKKFRDIMKNTEQCLEDNQ